MPLLDKFNFGWIGKKFTSIRCFVVVISLMIFTKIGFNVYLIVVLRTIERKYGLSSKQTGVILSTNDLVYTSVVLFVGHFARKFHKPRLIGYMNLVTILGYVIMSLPHFLITEDYDSRGNKRIVFATFILAQICIGFGSSATIVHGFSYVDDNSDQRTSPVYIGIMMSMFSLAPLFGYMVAAISTRIPEDLYTEMAYDNSIGAWWLGFLVIAGLKLCVIIVLLVGFPERQFAFQGGAVSANVKDELRELPRYFARLLRNKEYVALLLESLFASYTIIGVFTYMPRFLEIHFHIPAFKASLFSGGSAIFGFCGSIYGGAIMKRLRIQVRGAAWFVVLSASATCACLLTTVFLSCPQDTLVGRRDLEPFPGNCSCDTSDEMLTCYENVTFLSKCLITCRDPTVSEKLLESKAGFCSGQCNLIYVYLVIFSFMILIVSVARTPTIYVFFRIIESSEKSFALALRSFFVNIFCFIPGPLFYGHVIDLCCKFWNNGACVLYDTDKFRIYTYGLTLIFNVLALLFAILLCVLLSFKKAKVQVLAKNLEHIDMTTN